MLRLKAERVALTGHRPASQHGCPVEEVAGVELHTGLIAEDREGSPARRLLDVRGDRRSNGVPSTGDGPPVGTNRASTGR
jgi:hypothetical protein